MFRKQLNENQQAKVEQILEKILRKIADNSEDVQVGGTEKLCTSFFITQRDHEEIDYMADLLGIHL